jgi:CubicO group peptidase (beta-lactamase class C family)
MRNQKLIILFVAVAILVVLAIVFIPRLLKGNQVSAPDYWPTQGWRTTTPEEQGFDSAKLAEGLQAAREKGMEIDGLMLIRDGKVMLDATFYPYDGTFPHDVASVTKSITTTLIGIAEAQGKLDLDDKLVSFFPDRTIANLDEHKEQITIRDMVGMRNGFKSKCIQGDQANIAEMTAAPDWVQFALDRKVTQKPGGSFCYDSPGMHLLSAVLQQATGMTELEFARKYLFEPLGIQEIAWKTDPQGYTFGPGDLHLKPADAAKIGFLYLNNGIWEGKQIVPAEWVEEAVKPQVQANADESYGYGWWFEDDIFYATGRGGQKIFVVPALDAIVVSAGGGYEYDEIDPYITGSMVDLENPLPANPEGLAKLEAALETIQQPASPFPEGGQPDTSVVKSGETYVFSPNHLSLVKASLNIDDPAEVVFWFEATTGEKASWPIGLDGQYRLAADGQATRGYWADPTTFIFETFDIGHMTYRLHFEEGSVVLDSPDLSIRAEGKIERP